MMEYPAFLEVLACIAVAVGERLSEKLDDPSAVSITERELIGQFLRGANPQGMAQLLTK